MTGQYYQCLLRRASSEMVSWIEKRGAKVGEWVELLPSRELWLVVEVYELGLSYATLKENEKLNRSYVKRTDR